MMSTNRSTMQRPLITLRFMYALTWCKHYCYCEDVPAPCFVVIGRLLLKVARGLPWFNSVLVGVDSIWRSWMHSQMIYIYRAAESSSREERRQRVLIGQRAFIRLHNKTNVTLVMDTKPNTLEINPKNAVQHIKVTVPYSGTGTTDV